MLPTREEALKLIRDGLLFNPGPWGEHCLRSHMMYWLSIRLY